MSNHAPKHKSRRLRRFLRGNKAVSALEYALLVGIIAVAVGVGIAYFGGKLEGTIKKVGNKVGQISTPAIPSSPF